MNRIEDLTLFLRVLDLGSISAAARHLDLSVAVASHRLKRLESELGVRLLHRTTRQLSATAEGSVLAKHGRTLIDDLDALTSGLRHAGTRITGTLRLTVSSAFGRLYISPLLPEFLCRYPDVRLHIDLNDQVTDLVGLGFDLAIRIGTLRDSSLVAQKLTTNRRVLCASPDYLRRRGTPKRPADLKNHECLLKIEDDGRQDVWRLIDGQRQIDIRVKGRLDSNVGDLLRDAAVGGLGIAQLSTWHACEDLRAGRLNVILPDYPVPDTGIHAVMPRRQLIPPRVRAFISFLTEQLGQQPPWEKGLHGVSKRSHRNPRL